MKKLIGSAIAASALLLMQVVPSFAMTHWEEAQWNTQQAVCMLVLANSSTDQTVITNNVISAISFYNASELHIGLAQGEPSDWKHTINMEYMSHLVPAARIQAERSLKLPQWGLWAKVLVAYKAGVMVNKEFMKFVNVTGGACG